MFSMRLFTRNGWYYIEFGRANKKSLKTKDKEKARQIFERAESERIQEKFFPLDPERRITLGQFKDLYLATRINAPRKTYKADKLALNLLIDVLGKSTALRVVNEAKIENFKKACLARDCKPISINTYLRHIKAALSVAADWYPTFKRPKIAMFKVKRLPRPLDPRQINKLLKRAKKHWPDFYPMLIIFLWTGIRRSEILTLQWENIRLDKQAIARIVGKGNKERIIPLAPEVVAILRPIQKDIGPVFHRVHPDTLTHWFKKLADECKVSARLHDLRHSAATYMLASGTPIKVVQKILGHASVTTTEIYADVLDEVVQKEFKLKFDL